MSLGLKKLKVRILVIAILAVVVLVTLLFSIYLQRWFKQEQFKGENVIASIVNPDFIYQSEGFLSDFGEWSGNGYYYPGIVDGRYGIVVIHPINTSVGSYIEKSVYLLPGKKYLLKVSLADIAGKIPGKSVDEIAGPPVSCADVLFFIKIYDKETGLEDILYEAPINAEDGWVDLSFDISNYSGKEISLKIESFAGGPCGNWNGEWAAIDYVAIEEK